MSERFDITSRLYEGEEMTRDNVASLVDTWSKSKGFRLEGGYLRTHCEARKTGINLHTHATFPTDTSFSKSVRAAMSDRPAAINVLMKRVSAIYRMVCTATVRGIGIEPNRPTWAKLSKRFARIGITSAWRSQAHEQEFHEFRSISHALRTIHAALRSYLGDNEGVIA